MGQSTRIEVEFDDRRYSALQDEAQRLGVGVEQVVARATSAWICEMADNAATCTTTSQASVSAS